MRCAPFSRYRGPASKRRDLLRRSLAEDRRHEDAHQTQGYPRSNSTDRLHLFEHATLLGAGEPEECPGVLSHNEGGVQVDLSPYGCFGSDRWRRGDLHSNRTQIDAEVVMPRATTTPRTRSIMMRRRCLLWKSLMNAGMSSRGGHAPGAVWRLPATHDK